MALQPSPHPRKTIIRRSSGSQVHQAYAFGAPTAGLDVSQPLPGGDPMKAVRLENLIPRVLGCQMRAGYTRWSPGLDGEVRTLMDYRPPGATPAKLLAATSTGKIYDVTLQAAPVLLTTIAGGTPNGEWTWLNFTTDANVHKLVMVNPGTGMWIYDGAAFTHITPGAGVNQIAGVDPTSFVHVTAFKNRLWFVQANSDTAWYLGTGVYFGTAKQFQFMGSMLPHGGNLDVLINWTYDGSSGAGLSTQLVAVSTQGDIVAYAGEDPDEASSFSVAGRWYVGRVPVGRRYYSLYQTDIVILSERGMCFMSELMRGEGFFQNPQISQAINSAVAAEVARSLGTRYWEVVFLPQEQLIILNKAEFDSENLQWAYEVNNKAFAVLRGIPMLTAIVAGGETYSGDLAGNVWWCFEGSSDGIIGTTPGTDLQGTVVTTFQPMGEGIRLKRFLMVRASFISDAEPAIQVSLNKEWSLGISGNAPPFLGAGENFWDVGLWDHAVWAGEGQSYESWIGATGAGRYAALAMRVKGSPATIFVGWQALVEAGGIL
jgi:hypothetical protein